jgi:hypothetical protein
MPTRHVPKRGRIILVEFVFGLIKRRPKLILYLYNLIMCVCRCVYVCMYAGVREPIFPILLSKFATQVD